MISNDEELRMMGAILGASKEERLEFFKALFPNGMYHPYVPLTTVRSVDGNLEIVGLKKKPSEEG